MHIFQDLVCRLLAELGHSNINPYTGKATGQRLKVDFERGWRGALMNVVLCLYYLSAGQVRSLYFRIKHCIRDI